VVDQTGCVITSYCSCTADFEFRANTGLSMD